MTSITKIEIVQGNWADTIKYYYSNIAGKEDDYISPHDAERIYRKSRVERRNL